MPERGTVSPGLYLSAMAASKLLNGLKCRIPTAQSWIGGRCGARNDVLTPSSCFELDYSGAQIAGPTGYLENVGLDVCVCTLRAGSFRMVKLETGILVGA